MGQVLRLDTGYVPEAWERVERPVSKKELSAFLGVSTRTIDRWINPGDPRRGKLPRDYGRTRGAWLIIGHHRRFYVSRVREWLDS